MSILALLKIFAGDPLGYIWKWLCHRSFWQLVCIGLAGFAVVEHFQLVAARHDAARWEKQAVGLQTQIDAADTRAREAESASKQISQQLRKQTDEENRRIAGDANALRLRGPGKAICTHIPASPGGHVEGPPNANVAGPALPTDDRAAVPWGWLVQRSEEHDQLLAEVQAWRTWHDQVLKVWPKNTEAQPK